MDYLSPTQQVIYLLEKTHKSYKRLAQKRLKLVDANITVDQATLLLLIKKNPDMPQTHMGTLLFKDFASVTRMIELMVQHKFITRKGSAIDRRRNTLQLSKKGEMTLKKIMPVLKSSDQLAFKNFGNYEINRLEKLLERIVDNCEN